MAQCFSCNGKSHLPCYDILQPAVKVFTSPNIVFVCDECLTDRSPVRKQTKGLLQATLSTGDLSISNTPTRQVGQKLVGKQAKDDATAKQLRDLTSQIVNNTKHLIALKDSIVQMDTTVRDCASKQETNFSNVNSTLTMNKEAIDSMVAGAAEKTSLGQVDFINCDNVRELDAQKKIALKKRTLTAGTFASSDHGLGNAVELRTRNPRNQQAKNLHDANRVVLTKSIFVSRLQTNVTVQNIVSYINKNAPSVDSSHFQVRMLVKKDQDLNELSYISFRLSCTDDLYGSFMAPSFWPPHVLIGEFKNFNKSPPTTSTEVADGSNEIHEAMITDDIHAKNDQPPASQLDK